MFPCCTGISGVRLQSIFVCIPWISRGVVLQEEPVDRCLIQMINNSLQFVLSTKVLYSAFLNHPTLGTCFFLDIFPNLKKLVSRVCVCWSVSERHPGSDPPPTR